MKFSMLNSDPELRTLMAAMKCARAETIGEMTARIGNDDRYWTNISAKKDGDTVVITVSSSTAFMGSDGPGQSVRDDDKIVARVPANGPAVVKALKAGIAGDDTLSRFAKPKDFAWFLGGSKMVRGLNAENAQMAIDLRILDPEVWRAKWVKPPPAAPLHVTSEMTLSDLGAELKRNGVHLSDSIDKWDGKWDRNPGYKILDPNPKRLLQLMTASFPVTEKRPKDVSFYLDYSLKSRYKGFFVMKKPGFYVLTDTL